MDVTTVFSTIIGTIPLLVVLVVYLLRVEHRLTKLETLLLDPNTLKRYANGLR